MVDEDIDRFQSLQINMNITKILFHFTFVLLKLQQREIKIKKKCAFQQKIETIVVVSFLL